MSTARSKSAARRKQALSRYRSARDQSYSGASALDDLGEFEEDDVYEEMNEEEYNDYARAKREREDFVVDDDGIGYHDDGEYDVGALHAEKGSVPPAGAAAAAGSKKKKSLAAAALKKARKNKAAAAANAAAGKGGTMWDFVNKGLAGPEAGRVQGGGKRKGGGGKERDGRGKGGDELDDELDDMIDAMDDAPEPSRSRGRSIGGRRSIGSRGGRPESSRKRRAYGSREPVRGGRASSASGRRRRSREHRSGEPTTERYREDEDEDVDFGGDGRDVDFGGDDDGADVFGNHDDDDEEEEKVAEDAPEAKDAEMEEAEEEDGVRDDEKPELPSVTQEPVAGEGKPAKKEEEAEAAVPVEAPRPRPGRLAGRLAGKKKEAEEKRAAEAKKAEEAMKLAERKEAEKKAKEAAAIAAKGDDKKGGANGIALDASSASFQLANIAAAGAVRDGGSKDLARIVRTEEPAEAMEVEGEEEEEKPEPRSYVDLFWLDAHERNGVVSLYGKVKVPVDGKGKGKDKGKDKSEEAFVYQSCCVVVPGNERNLFVLPRVLPKDGDDDEEDEGEDGERQRRAIGDVYDEMRSVLQPSCIPHAQGAAWKAKPVTRSYAFEDPSIPRGECQYLKVVYDGKYPVPDRRVCVNGGETFEKILGAGATNLENFLVKRRLMGPGWVRIYDPQPVAGGDVSWCKWECVAEGPKAVKRLDLATTPSGTKPVVPPAPPVSVVSLKFKTVVHPKTDQLEILCASAVCHDRVLLDAASDESERRMTQLTVVRPLDVDGAGAAARFPRDMEKEVKAGMPGLQKSPNERALLSRLFAQIGNWDPDVVASHNGWGHDIDLLLSRCVEHKVHFWSKIGRRKQMKLPSSSQFGNGKSWAVEQALEGRVLCDTLLSAKEFLSKETTYALTNLAKTQLKVDRQEIEQVDVPQWTRTGEHFVRLARHTLNDARLVQGLMFKLQALPLTKQLTNIAGNLWSRTLKGNRAERNEYLLLHEFHALKYVVPEKRTKKQREEETAGGGGDEGGAGGGSGSKNKPKYSGGLVLEPKKGLYDSFILLLDFNSLYPSLIQEYNLCFTTMEWAKGAGAAADGEEGGATPRGDDLPPLPDESLERGVLPRVIKTLVDRRRNVKKLMKNEKDGDKKEELNIRQMALKLTANSMYGCLGFSHSRFYAQPIAALVTAMGRETLQRTVDLAQTEIGLDVIYGDTDSIMIDTRIADLKDYPKVLELGNKVKREVNKLYRTLELEIDGVFRSMLLLKKKKYAAVTIAEGPDGEFVTDTEMKGLDLVRRDWCIQSKDSGRFVLDRILSGEEKEVVVNKIHEHLEEVAKKMRAGELPLEKYVITKGLNKHPNDYPDAKSLPHVHVAKTMLKEHKPVSIGDHIPYVITEETTLEEEEENGNQQKASSAKKGQASERARHPDAIERSDGALRPDVEWYLTQQILPPISRLCEPIEGTSPGILAEKLGLDSSKYKAVHVNIDEDDIVDYTPASCLPDEERFKDVEKFFVTCASCDEGAEFPGVFRLTKDLETGATLCRSGLRCPNPRCASPDHWGEGDLPSCLAKIVNKMTSMKRKQQKLYYDGLVRCDDPMCGLTTRQLSVCGDRCLKLNCNGKLAAAYTESALQTQLKYFDSLFDVEHALKQLAKSEQSSATEKDVMRSLAKEDRQAFELLRGFSSCSLDKSGYNWVSGQFFQALFGGH